MDNKKIRLFLFAFAISFIVFPLQAKQGGNDNFGYMWTDTAGTVTVDYQWIDIKDGTRLDSDLSPSTVYGPIALPFTFTFYGVYFNSIYISSNGWVSFSAPGGPFPGNTTIPSGAGPDSMIAVFWDDLSALTGTYGLPGIYYKTVGSTPNRKFIVLWQGYTFNVPTRDVQFELILYEKSNNIKCQYNYLSGTLSATVGIKADVNTGIEYSFNQTVSNNCAILLHNKLIASSSASISPASAQAGSPQEFNYYINDIDPTDTTGLGKIDRIVIDNPFTSSTPTVTGIKINDFDAYIQLSPNKPTDPGYATWQYSGNSIIIQASYFNVIDSLKVTSTVEITNTLVSATSGR